MNPDLPPNHLETEQAFLGCFVISYKEASDSIAGKFPDINRFFYDNRHSDLWNCLQSLDKQNVPVDLVTLHQRSIPGVDLAYLSSLCDKTPSPVNAPYYAEILQNLYIRRRILQSFQRVKDKIDDPLIPSEELLTYSEKDILAIRNVLERPTEDSSSKHILHGLINEYQAASTGSQVDFGLQTGLAGLDAMAGGLRKGEVVVVAGGTSTGKSALGFGIASHVAGVHQVPVGYFSLEMTAEDLLKRAVASQSRIPVQTCERGLQVERDFARVTEAIKIVNKLPIHINDHPNRTFESIAAYSRKWVSEKKIQLIVVDHLHLIAESQPGETAIVKLSRASSGFKRLAKELNIPIILLAQLNRGPENEQRPPRLSDLRDCGTVENDADSVWMLYPKPVKTDEKVPEPREVGLILRKQRRGQRDAWVKLLFFGSITKFESATHEPD